MSEQAGSYYYGSPDRQCPPAYLRTTLGKLKIPEMVLSMLVFICSMTVWASAGHGWIEFAGFWTFVEVTIWLIVHCADIVPQIAWNYMVELWCYLGNTIFLFIAGIIAAANASSYHYSSGRVTLAMTSIFAFTAMVICGLDGYLQLCAYRERRATAESSGQSGRFDASPGTAAVDRERQPEIYQPPSYVTTTTVVTEFSGSTPPPAYYDVNPYEQKSGLR